MRSVAVETEVNTPTFRVLGTRVNAVQIPGVIAWMEEWISNGRNCHFIAVTNIHGVVEGQHDGSFKKVLSSADLVVPDGMPLVWLGRLRGHRLQRRVYGPDLLMEFMHQTNEKTYRHFFFGGALGIPEELAAKLKAQFPALRVVGTYSPPFRSLTAEEDDSVIKMINDTAPDVLWVGLGCPKQERWMYEHRDRLKVPVVVGVGQAFDLHAGTKQPAPAWMREHGFEWLFRLLQEPRRLWRRYLIYGTEFLWNVSLELLGLKQFS
jgi:N-acetylglucosaminyldiphosphoundecaprenol N-acetyl-beta-D-mannosaminyltransferase